MRARSSSAIAQAQSKSTDSKQVKAEQSISQELLGLYHLCDTFPNMLKATLPTEDQNHPMLLQISNGIT